MLGCGVDAATLVAALGAGPPPPECRWGRRPHRGATAFRLLALRFTGARAVPLTMHAQALACLSNREVIDATKGRTFHCKMANNRQITVFFL